MSVPFPLNSIVLIAYVEDDMSQDFDFEEGARVTRMNILVGYLVAESEQRPTWNPGDFFGEKFGRAQPSSQDPL